MSSLICCLISADDDTNAVSGCAGHQTFATIHMSATSGMAALIRFDCQSPPKRQRGLHRLIQVKGAVECAGLLYVTRKTHNHTRWDERKTPESNTNCDRPAATVRTSMKIVSKNKSPNIALDMPSNSPRRKHKNMTPTFFIMARTISVICCGPPPWWRRWEARENMWKLERIRETEKKATNHKIKKKCVRENDDDDEDSEGKYMCKTNR